MNIFLRWFGFFILFILLCTSTNIYAAELISETRKIIASENGLIPQAPRVSPDGQQLVFEYYSKEKVELWLAGSDGSNTSCLTCSLPPGATKFSPSAKIENGYWHPSGRYLLFNKVPEQGERIYVGELEGGKLTEIESLIDGSRAQFSKPNGNVIFFQDNNKLSYRILGPDPIHPYDSLNIELRGPIAKLNQQVEVSHPSLAPDGTTILFAARAGSISKVNVNDIDRQRLFGLWSAMQKIPVEKINQELKKFDDFFLERGSDAKVLSVDSSPSDFPGQAFSLLLREKMLLSEPVLVKGMTRRDLLLLWSFGFLNKLDPKYENEIQQLIYSRIWTTDVFGAPIEPLVKDLASAPFPQKWPTVAKDGSFAVFEAGHWKNRQIYLVAKKKGKWQERAVKITEKGSYNSSPEIDPTGQWLFFESNRDGGKGIWRARLDWPTIKKQLDL